MTTFELVPDDEREDAPDAAPTGPPDDRRERVPALRDRTLARWRALSRRGRVVVAAGTAVVVLAAATAAVAPGLLDARDQRLRAEAVAGMPGVVGDLSQPLAVTWEARQPGSVAAIVAGGLVAVTQGNGVRALDPASGEVAWERDLGGSAWCGPAPWQPAEWSVEAQTVVCVSDDGSTVTTLDAAGEVLRERQIARADTSRAGVLGVPAVTATAGGAIAVLEQGPTVTVPWEDGDDPAHTLEALRDAGWTAPTVRVEDAVSGEVRATVPLELSAEHLRECGIVEDGDGATLDLQPWVEASPSSTTVSLCGTRQSVTPSGEVVDLGDGLRSLAPLAGGGYVVRGETSEILGPDGGHLTTINGWVVPPMLDTEPDGPVLTMLGGTGSSATLSAVGRDGESVWSHPISSLTMPLSRVSGTVVIAGEGGALAALDAATGKERWRLPEMLDEADGSGEHVSGVVTDGTRLLLSVSRDIIIDTETGEMRADHRLVALDLRDGTTAWQQEWEGDLQGVVAVAGNVVAQGAVLTGLGHR